MDFVKFDKQDDLKNFCTNSTYIGSFDVTRRVMNGCGIYTYPDGSTYTGKFMNGHFEGPGTLVLSKPYNVIIKGEFSANKLMKLSDIEFADSLQLVGDVEKNSLNFTKWLYCSTMDRRFLIEHVSGINPVGPTAYQTVRYHTRQLNPSCYDVEEGIYDLISGEISKREPPLTESYYISCPLYKKWILKHCRTNKVITIPRGYGKYILHTNIANEEPLYAHGDKCICETPFEKQFSRPFSQKCDYIGDINENKIDVLSLSDITDKSSSNTLIKNSSFSRSDIYSVLMSSSELMSNSDGHTSNSSLTNPNILRMWSPCRGRRPLYEELSHFDFASTKRSGYMLTSRTFYIKDNANSTSVADCCLSEGETKLNLDDLSSAMSENEENTLDYQSDEL